MTYKTQRQVAYNFICPCKLVQLVLAVPTAYSNAFIAVPINVSLMVAKSLKTLKLAIWSQSQTYYLHFTADDLTSLFLVSHLKSRWKQLQLGKNLFPRLTTYLEQV